MTPPAFALQDGQTIVFIGDSITDCGRRDAFAPLGDGYVRLVAGLATAKYPQRQVRFINTGIGGDTVLHLTERWQADALDHRPDWLSVSIGVNDVWRQLDKSGPGVLVGPFEEAYRRLLQQTREVLPACRLVLMTAGIHGQDPESPGNRMLRPYNAAIERLAGEFQAVCVPIHAAFRVAIAADGSRPWTTDGVHPTPIGHALMALTWLRALGW